MTWTVCGRPLQFGEVDISHNSTTRCVAAYLDLGDSLWPFSALTWDRDRKTVEMVIVSDELRRQGLATRLLDLANQVDGPLGSTEEASVAGEAFAKAKGLTLTVEDRLGDREAEAIGARLFMAIQGRTTVIQSLD